MAPLRALCALAAAALPAYGFYMPGIAPKEYANRKKVRIPGVSQRPGRVASAPPAPILRPLRTHCGGPSAQVPLMVNKVTSTKTQLPYQYYDLPFCHPKKRKEASENLGEVLQGDVITNSM